MVSCAREENVVWRTRQAVDAVVSLMTSAQCWR